MGYGFYFVYGWADASPTGFSYGRRPAGYMVTATCDQRGCGEEIDRGLGYLCGDVPHGPSDDEPGCGRYFCGKHLTGVGSRGGCGHRGHRAWGKTLACMALSEVRDDQIRDYCLDLAAHDGPHAWAMA